MHYEVHVASGDTHTLVVELESPPQAQDGEVLELTLEDGRVLLCQVRGSSPYCRVLAEETTRGFSAASPAVEAPVPRGRRRSDIWSSQAIDYSCPHCLASETLVTHRGVTLTSLFCPVCRHGWGESPSAIASAPRVDRRQRPRTDAPGRRGVDQLQPPSCTYCGTAAHVRAVRDTRENVFFACSGCDAMWAIPKSL